jgi:hypothetical protein
MLTSVSLGGPRRAILVCTPGKTETGYVVDHLGATHDVKVVVSKIEAGPPGEWLIDARGVVNINVLWREDGTTQVFEWDWIPSSRPLYAILAEAVQHGVDHPTHGYNCACMDNLIREVRVHVHRATPPYRFGVDAHLTEDERNNAWLEHLNALDRMRHILGAVSRGL